MFRSKSRIAVVQRLIGSWYLLMSVECKELCRRSMRERRRKKAGDGRTYTWQVPCGLGRVLVKCEW